MLVTTIIVTLQIEGIHSWPEAAIALPEVGYLSNPHRHIFYFKVEKEVSHSDRDVEIIMFKRQLVDYFHRHYYSDEFKMCDFGPMSCEMIAECLLKDYSCISVECLEDNENGARVKDI